MSVQSGIAVAEQSLANSESDLTKLLNEVAAAVEKSAGSGGTGSGGTGGTGGSGGTGGTAAAPGEGEAAQAAEPPARPPRGQLPRPNWLPTRPAWTAANAQLSVARQNLAAATLAAPITGTVALVNITPGQQVTGSQGSGTTADFVIEGAGGEEATTTVSVSDVGEIRVGQPATVTLDGSATPISGQVVAVGMLSTTSSTGTASYPVTIGLAAGAPTLFAGSDAQVAITLAKVSDAITVPTSAVEGTRAATFVTVLRAGKPVRVRVVVGATGPVSPRSPSASPSAVKRPRRYRHAVARLTRPLRAAFFTTEADRFRERRTEQDDSSRTTSRSHRAAINDSFVVCGNFKDSRLCQLSRTAKKIEVGAPQQALNVRTAIKYSVGIEADTGLPPSHRQVEVAAFRRVPGGGGGRRACGPRRGGPVRTDDRASVGTTG